MNETSTEIWLRMYEEQIRHVRHHEKLRSQATNIIIAVSAALLAFFASNTTSSGHEIEIGAFIIIVNLYGLIMSRKHYERSRLHARVASNYRDAISEITPLSNLKINEVRSIGRNAHAKQHAWIRNIRAHYLWSGLHLLLVALGILVIYTSPQ